MQQAMEHFMVKRTSNVFRRTQCIVALAVLSALGGCQAAAITALGAGASAGFSHTMNGMTSRTFTAPAQRVKTATLAALKRMGGKVEPADKAEKGFFSEVSEKPDKSEIIRASMPERTIEIEIERISANATYMKVVAKQGSLFYDKATATEIIVQAERLMTSTVR
jgi:hypothetical protein